jgi:hypothetical protein
MLRKVQTRSRLCRYKQRPVQADGGTVITGTFPFEQNVLIIPVTSCVRLLLRRLRRLLRWLLLLLRTLDFRV